MVVTRWGCVPFLGSARIVLGITEKFKPLAAIFTVYCLFRYMDIPAAPVA
jgi:hypothetical protein